MKSKVKSKARVVAFLIDLDDSKYLKLGSYVKVHALEHGELELETEYEEVDE